MKFDPVAAIDLGTNTARLLIARITPAGCIDPIVIKRCITRLGGGFSRKTGLSEEAWQRSLLALQEFAVEIRNHGVRRVGAVATSAVRDAANGAAFCAAVLQDTGIVLNVIDGGKEGLLTLNGVRAGLDKKTGRFFIFDVGGGSTEYTIADGGTPLFTKSLPLGVVRLTEGKVTLGAMEEKITRELELLRREVVSSHDPKTLAESTLVGTAGTATTLASISMQLMDYDYRKINNSELSLPEVRRIFKLLLPLSPEERTKVPGLEKGREDLIIAGTLITIKTMELFGFEKLKISDSGLLEGVLLETAATPVA